MAPIVLITVAVLKFVETLGKDSQEAPPEVIFLMFAVYLLL